MKYEFRILLASNVEVRPGFFADSESAARDAAIEWAGEGATVGECVGRWTVTE